MWNIQWRSVLVGANVVVERSVVRIVDSGVLNDEESSNEEDEEDEDEDGYRLQTKNRGVLRNSDDDLFVLVKKHVTTHSTSYSPD